jgi:hypothetical protein
MNSVGRYWKTLDRFVEIRSPWLTLIGEHLQDDQGQLLDYWRVERANTIVVLPILVDHLILPTPTYRPGVGEPTLDFPVGEYPMVKAPVMSWQRRSNENSGVTSEAIAQITPLNSEGWVVNSSFSNQKLYGFVVNLQPTTTVPAERTGATYPITLEGIYTLLKELSCLQCRAVLMEWQINKMHDQTYDLPSK